MTYALLLALGALLGAPGSASAHSKPAATPHEAAQPGPAMAPAVADEDGPRWKTLLGGLHPVAVHFPIALIVAAFAAELASIRWKHPDWAPVVRFCSWGGASGALAASMLGWFALASVDSESRGIAETHRALAIVSTALGCVVLVALARAERSNRRGLFRALLTVEFALVSVTGLLGGALVHGFEHLPGSFQ